MISYKSYICSVKSCYYGNFVTVFIKYFFCFINHFFFFFFSFFSHPVRYALVVALLYYARVYATRGGAERGDDGHGGPWDYVARCLGGVLDPAGGSTAAPSENTSPSRAPSPTTPASPAVPPPVADAPPACFSCVFAKSA